jgi:hypothetical protein
MLSNSKLSLSVVLPHSIINLSLFHLSPLHFRPLSVSQSFVLVIFFPEFPVIFLASFLVVVLLFLSLLVYVLVYVSVLHFLSFLVDVSVYVSVSVQHCILLLVLVPKRNCQNKQLINFQPPQRHEQLDEDES